MSARVVNVSGIDAIFQGDQVEAQVTVYDSNNERVSLATGTVDTITYQIQNSDKSTGWLVQLGVGSGITVRSQVGGDIGVFDMVILPADTAPLSGVLYHECMVTLQTRPRTILYGEFEVKVSPIK